jgi:hypothetical protein
MKCSDLQLSLGAEPSATSPELEAHLRECAACAEYRREMLKLDADIRRAMLIDPDAIPVPAAASSVPSHSRVRQWALAASVLLTIATILVMWGALPRHSLAADVVSHVISEPIPGALDRPVDADTIRDVMAYSGMKLDPINPSIVFMRTCLIRGRFVPHFIVRTEHGVATVMILPDEFVKEPEPFEGNGYKGLLLPNGTHGSIAVLSRSDFDPMHYAGEVRRAVRWIPSQPPGD